MNEHNDLDRIQGGITKEKEDAFFLCECSSEVLVAQTYDEDDWDDYVYLSIHYFGYRRKMNMFERIKYAFNFIKNGRMYEDQIILSKKNAEDLSTWLKK
jgi:hypothetical protein